MILKHGFMAFLKDNIFQFIEIKIKKIVFLIRYGKSLTLSNTLVRRVKFYNEDKSNRIIMGNIRMYNSQFILNGINNCVKLNNSTKNIYGLSIKVYGDNNKIFIDENACIYGLRIVVRGTSCRVFIGKDFSENINCMMTCMGKDNFIKIGNDCMFSENIDIWNTDSHLILDPLGNVLNKNKSITIGDHVWIGKKCSILKGVNVGNNSVIGMSSVVTSNVDSGSIYVGNPARKIKGNIIWSRDFAIM